MQSSDKDPKPDAHVRTLARALSNPHFSTGDRAKLRRMAVAGQAPLAFHRLILRHVNVRWQAEKWLPAWRTLVCALTIPSHSGYDERIALGHALAEAGFSELRLERLLASTGPSFNTLLLRAARQLSAKAQRADWRDAAKLLFASNTAEREEANSRLARAYYRRKLQD